MPTVTARSVAVTATLRAAAFDVDLGGPALRVTVAAARARVEHERTATTVAAAATLGQAQLEHLVVGTPVAARIAVVAAGRISNLTATPVAVRVGVVAPRVEFGRATALTGVQRVTTVRPRREVRFLAQRVLDRTWLSNDVPIRTPKVAWKLNGATEITGTLDARELYATGLDEWAVYLHAERDERIVASAMLMPFSPGGAVVDISAAGVTRYPHGTPYQGEFKLGKPIGQQIDPLDVVRDIWAHVQTYPDGRLGVVVAPTTSTVRIGSPEESREFATAAGANVAFTSGPYLLKWWDDTDCGREIDDLAKETPFDYREAPRWNTDRTDVVQAVDLGWPRLGRDQPDLAFAEGQNLTEALTPVEDDERYASEVIVLGSGEGVARVRGRYGTPVAARVRRAVVLEDKSITTTARADSKARAEWLRRRGNLTFEKISLKARHANAPLGAFAVGDDIPVRARVDGIGRVDIRHRVTALEWSPDTSSLVATCARSDSFTYTAPVAS